jgi:hypothetical protein
MKTGLVNPPSKEKEKKKRPKEKAKRKAREQKEIKGVSQIRYSIFN